MIVALLAAGAMLITDILGSCMVIFEASNRGWLAGAMDTAGWYFSIFTTAISVTAIESHNTAQKIEVLLLVGLANLIGTKLGVMTGNAIVRRKATP